MLKCVTIGLCVVFVLTGLRLLWFTHDDDRRARTIWDEIQKYAELNGYPPAEIEDLELGEDLLFTDSGEQFAVLGHVENLARPNSKNSFTAVP